MFKRAKFLKQLLIELLRNFRLLVECKFCKKRGFNVKMIEKSEKNVLIKLWLRTTT